MCFREDRDPEIGFRIITSLSKIYKIDEEFAKEAGILTGFKEAVLF